MPLRRRPAARWLPPALGALVAAVGAVNVASALTPEAHKRVQLVLSLAPAEAVMLARALALPAGAFLIVMAFYVARRRRGALWAVVGVLTGLALLNVLKGFDIAEMTLCVGLAALLVRNRGAFEVRHAVGTVWATVRQTLATAAGAVAVGVAMVAAAAHWISPEPSARGVIGEALSLLVLSPHQITFSGPAEWIPRAVEMLGVAAAAAVAAIVLRPARAVLRRSSPALVQQLIRRHGADTLSYFKLRGDLVDLFTSDRRAFLSCKVEHGVMLVAGDPVGAPEALPELITDACSVADRSGLRLGVLGASEDFADLARGAGLRAMYVGDEAIVDTAGFSLTGRKIRKVRQSVTRVEREGYTFAVKEHAALTPADLDSLDAVSAEWRAGAPERGFSMALDSMRGSHLGDSLVAFARDANGDVRGFLHLVPAYGRAAMSLSAMRRHPDTPNGLMEFLVVRSIEALREREVAELSLNFAAFARWMHDPSTRLQRLLGRVVALLNPFFQIESLYRFNAKFGPEWQPRYLLFDGPAALPRTAFAALTAEGFVPRPGLRVAEAWRRRFPGRAPVPQPVAEPAGGHA